MAASQQFSLRWNNYSHHITTTFDDLRAGDELTDVTLSCEGKRIKAHKMLLSACSVYFRDTFRENPCKHPIIILKGVSYVDLQAVVTFMYNGQVNVTQERLPFFLQTAELLQIKGLTDMNEKDESNVARPQSSTLSTNTGSSSVPHTSSLDSTVETPEITPRPPTPKRKRFNMASQNPIEPTPSTSTMGLIGFSSQGSSAVISGGGGAGHGSGVGNGLAIPGPSITSVTGSGGSSSSSLINPHSVVIPPDSNSTDTFPGGALVKYEDDDLPDDDDYDKNDMSEDNDNSVQDILGSMETGALGSYRSGGSGLPGSSSSMNKDLSGTDTSSHGGFGSNTSAGYNSPFLLHPLPLNAAFTFGFTSSGSPAITLENKTFVKHYTNNKGDTTYWRCRSRGLCKARVAQKDFAFTISGTHTC